jgi:hypothetical protein
MTTFITYRDGMDKLETRIKTAVGHFYQSRQRLPVCIVVNRSELDAARVAAETLALSVLVGSIGGCLVPEVWLEVDNTTGGKI